ASVAVDARPLDGLERRNAWIRAPLDARRGRLRRPFDGAFRPPRRRLRRPPHGRRWSSRRRRSRRRSPVIAPPSRVGLSCGPAVSPRGLLLLLAPRHHRVLGEELRAPLVDPLLRLLGGR